MAAMYSSILSLLARPAARLLIPGLLSAAVLACDRHTSPYEDLLLSVECTISSPCGSNTQFGMVGDSWTDLAAGVPLIVDLHDQLEHAYGFRMTTSNLAGLTLKAEWETRRGFEQVIRKAGPNIRYILLSLGGNDIIGAPGAYSLDAQTTLDTRLLAYDTRLRLLITNGDLLKQSLYGGQPLIWIIHGYDYPNPQIDPTCVDTYTGTTPARNDLPRFMVDGFNQKLQYLTTQIPNLRYIDGRRTLGGPPTSADALMFDCIHPNDAGFVQYAAAYVAKLDLLTGGAR